MDHDEDEPTTPARRAKANRWAETAGDTVKGWTAKASSTRVGESVSGATKKAVKAPGAAIAEMSLHETLSVLEEALEQLVAVVVAQEAELASQRKRIEELERRRGR